MKKTLATIGLFLFPLLGFISVIAVAMISLGSNSRDFRPDKAMQAVYAYRAVLLVSVVGFVSSVAVLIRIRR